MCSNKLRRNRSYAGINNVRKSTHTDEVLLLRHLDKNGEVVFSISQSLTKAPHSLTRVKQEIVALVIALRVSLQVSIGRVIRSVALTASCVGQRFPTFSSRRSLRSAREVRRIPRNSFQFFFKERKFPFLCSHVQNFVTKGSWHRVLGNEAHLLPLTRGAPRRAPTCFRWFER